MLNMELSTCTIKNINRDLTEIILKTFIVIFFCSQDGWLRNIESCRYVIVKSLRTGLNIDKMIHFNHHGTSKLPWIETSGNLFHTISFSVLQVIQFKIQLAYISSKINPSQVWRKASRKVPNMICPPSRQELVSVSL